MTVYAQVQADGYVAVFATCSGAPPEGFVELDCPDYAEHLSQGKRYNTTTNQWESPTISSDIQWLSVRSARGSLLVQSDWTQLPDVPLATKEAWATYRQALRDITLQPDPLNIVWPTPPS